MHKKFITDFFLGNTILARFVNGNFWAVSGSVISSILSVISSVLIARLLGKQLYGELGIIQTTLNMFLTFACFGLGLTTTKFVAEYKLVDKNKTGRIISLSLVIAFVIGIFFSLMLFIFSSLIATKILANPNLTSLLRISSITLLFNAINGVQIGELMGFEEFKSLAQMNIIASCVKFCTLLFLTITFGLWGSVLSLLITSLFNIFLYRLAIKETRWKTEISLDYKNCFKERNILIYFSIPAVLSGFLTNPVVWICNAIFANQPNGYAEMGIYNAANQFRLAVLQLPNMASNVVLPMLSSSNNKDEKKLYNKFFLYNVLLNIGIATIVAIGISIFSKIITKIYGPGFESLQEVILILVWTAVLTATASSIGQAITSKGKMWFGFLLNLLWAIFLLIFAWLLKGSGAVGLAYSYLFAYIFHLISSSLVSYLLIKRF